MAYKKWPKPCDYCKGQSKVRCMMCGWKKSKKLRDLSLAEQAKIRGDRERKQFLHTLDGSITKADNHTTASLDQSSKDFLEAKNIDAVIMEHREFALDMLRQHNEGSSYKQIADTYTLTVSLVARIIQLARDKVNRGIMEVELKPRTQPEPKLDRWDFQ